MNNNSSNNNNKKSYNNISNFFKLNKLIYKNLYFY